MQNSAQCPPRDTDLYAYPSATKVWTKKTIFFWHAVALAMVETWLTGIKMGEGQSLRASTDSPLEADQHVDETTTGRGSLLDFRSNTTRREGARHYMGGSIHE
jgi:hypothetical protein